MHCWQESNVKQPAHVRSQPDRVQLVLGKGCAKSLRSCGAPERCMLKSVHSTGHLSTVCTQRLVRVGPVVSDPRQNCEGSRSCCHDSRRLSIAKTPQPTRALVRTLQSATMGLAPTQHGVQPTCPGYSSPPTALQQQPAHQRNCRQAVSNSC